MISGGGLIGLAIAITGLISAFGGACLGKWINEKIRNQIGILLRQVEADCNEMRLEIRRIQTGMDTFENDAEGPWGYTATVKTADLCVERLLRNHDTWEEFKTYLSEEIAQLERLRRNPDL